MRRFFSSAFAVVWLANFVALAPHAEVPNRALDHQSLVSSEDIQSADASNKNHVESETTPNDCDTSLPTSTHCHHVHMCCVIKGEDLGIHANLLCRDTLGSTLDSPHAVDLGSEKEPPKA